MAPQRSSPPDHDATLLEHCRSAGRRSRAAGVLRKDNPFERVIRRSHIGGSAPVEVWEGRSAAWIEGWDLADAQMRCAQGT